MLLCGHRKELENLIGVLSLEYKVVVKVIISSVISEPPLMPQMTEQAVILQKPPPTEHL